MGIEWENDSLVSSNMAKFAKSSNCRFGHGKHIYKLGCSVAMFDSLRVIDIIFAKKGTKFN